MANKFAVVGISGLLVCAVCLGAAAAIGGNALRDSGIDFGGPDRPRCDFEFAGKQGERAMAWTDGDTVNVSLPANVHYRAGQGDQVVIKGDSAVLPHIQIRDGEIRPDCRTRNFGGRLDITLPGRAFRHFGMAGSGSLTLEGIDQPDLKIRLAGSEAVEASGKTGNLDLRMAGSGDARMGALAANNVRLKMAGSNDVEVAPRDDLHVEMAGSGKVRLRTEPRQIETHIAGSGQIIHSAELDKTR